MKQQKIPEKVVVEKQTYGQMEEDKFKQKISKLMYEVKGDERYYEMAESC